MSDADDAVIFLYSFNRGSAANRSASVVAATLAVSIAAAIFVANDAAICCARACAAPATSATYHTHIPK